MKKSIFGNNKIEGIYVHLIQKYNKEITTNMKNAIKIILSEKDIDNRNMLINQVKDIYQLTDKQLEEYILVIKLELLYTIMMDNLSAISELLSENNDLFGDMEEEMLEINNMRQEIEDILVKIDEISKEKITLEETDNNEYQELSSVSNFIILLDKIEEDRIKTIYSRSGKGQIAMSSILKEMNLFMNSNYDSLRKKGKIHQLNDVNKTQIVITKHNLAYERIGSITTKITYIRVPLVPHSSQILK